MVGMHPWITGTGVPGGTSWPLPGHGEVPAITTELQFKSDLHDFCMTPFLCGITAVTGSVSPSVKWRDFNVLISFLSGFL